MAVLQTPVVVVGKTRYVFVKQLVAVQSQSGYQADPEGNLRALKSSWRPRKECCMALKLIWRFVNTVFKEGPEVYRMVSSA